MKRFYDTEKIFPHSHNANHEFQNLKVSIWEYSSLRKENLLN